MMFSYIEVGAGSRAEFARPHFPTTFSTSGMLFTLLSSILITSRFSSIPECGMVVGISKNEPSSKFGINSFPVPGKTSVKEFHALLSFTKFGIKPNSFSAPCQDKIPNRITKTGIARNFFLFSKLHVKICV